MTKDQEIELLKAECDRWKESYGKLLKEHRELKRERILDYAVKLLSPKNGDFMVFTAERRFPKWFNARGVAEDIQAWCTKLNVEIAPWFVFLEKGTSLELVSRETLEQLLDAKKK